MHAALAYLALLIHFIFLPSKLLILLLQLDHLHKQVQQTSMPNMLSSSSKQAEQLLLLCVCVLASRGSLGVQGSTCSSQCSLLRHTGVPCLGRFSICRRGIDVMLSFKRPDQHQTDRLQQKSTYHHTYERNIRPSFVACQLPVKPQWCDCVRWYNLPAWSNSSFPFSGLCISVYHVVAVLLPCYAAGPGCHPSSLPRPRPACLAHWTTWAFGGEPAAKSLLL